ncbi:MAG TPA: hypothetical protein VN260_03235 [Dissulfurispiraceae bacterium]|nr:hypothetical protein [Dissulfurispiraceae bacterium]
MMNVAATKPGGITCKREYEQTCPYCSELTNICGASLSAMAITWKKRVLLCNSENHDNCPVYLAKCLRG